MNDSDCPFQFRDALQRDGLEILLRRQRDNQSQGFLGNALELDFCRVVLKISNTLQLKELVDGLLGCLNGPRNFCAIVADCQKEHGPLLFDVDTLTVFLALLQHQLGDQIMQRKSMLLVGKEDQVLLLRESLVLLGTTEQEPVGAK